MLEGNKIDRFRAALEGYVRDHPRTWEALAYLRHDEYNTDTEQITLRLAFRHRNSWQAAARILQNRGQLLRFVFETGKAMKINFQAPPDARVVYQGGSLNSMELPGKMNSSTS